MNRSAVLTVYRVNVRTFDASPVASFLDTADASAFLDSEECNPLVRGSFLAASFDVDATIAREAFRAAVRSRRMGSIAVRITMLRAAFGGMPAAERTEARATLARWRDEWIALNSDAIASAAADVTTLDPWGGA